MRAAAVLLFALPLLPADAALGADPVLLIQNTAGRQTLSLNGAWKTIVDPYQMGYIDFHDHPYADGGIGAGRTPTSKSDHTELAFRDSSPELAVPGDWNTQRPDLFWYEGSIWYKRDFDYAPKPGRRQFLWFGAANYQAVVFLNGKKLGEHIGGFTPFEFEVTGLIKERGNFVIVMVDNQRHREGVPTPMTDWWNYGGLTRDVKLVDEPQTFVQDYFVQLEKGSLNRVAGWVRLNGPQHRQKVTVRIPQASAAITLNTNDDGYATFAFPASLTLWSPEHPALYDVDVEAESDRVGDRIGFRSIQTSGQHIVLNGKPVFLRGASIHAEAPFRQGRVFSEADARTLLRWAKDLGCNFVRLAHYPHDESMERVADEMGLLVWSEVPVYWAIQWDNAATYANAERQLTESITRDKNRASVILWSVANETPLGDARLKFLSSLAATARSLDPTRLITAATLTHYSDATTIEIDDPLGKVLDVIGCNEYIGWYDGKPEKADGITWKTSYDKPVVMSEFGAEAVAGYHGDEETAWTEEEQANIYRHQVKMFQRIPFLQGTVAWILVDFRSPRRPLAQVQEYFNRKGLYSERGEKKAAFFVLRDFYRKMEAEGSRQPGTQ